MNGSDRVRRLAGSVLICIGLIAGVASLAQPATAIQAATQTVPLHNDVADPEDDCPSQPGRYWHFVIAPNNDRFEFVEITLNVGGAIVTVSGAAIVPNGSQLDNVFVRVPDGADHDDLSTTGSFALVAPDSPTVRFVLSHVCTVGSGPSTTTTSTSTSTTTSTSTSTTTTTTSTTTSTSTTTTTTSSTPSTSTSTTTTTTASGGATTTTNAPGMTTTTSASGGATTTTDLSGGAGTTTTTPGGAATSSTLTGSGGPTSTVASGAVTTTGPSAVPLPTTGSNVATMLGVLSLLTISIGGALLLVARRTRNALGAPI